MKICCLQIFFNITFSKIVLRNNYRASNSLDLDKALNSDGPDLGLNCLQRLSVDGKICPQQAKGQTTMVSLEKLLKLINK